MTDPDRPELTGKRRAELAVGRRLAEAVNVAEGTSLVAKLAADDTLADVYLVDPRAAAPDRPVQVVRAPLDPDYWETLSRERAAGAKLTRVLRNAGVTGVAVFLTPQAHADLAEKLPEGSAEEVLGLVSLTGPGRLAAWDDVELYEVAPSLSSVFVSADCQPLGEADPAGVLVGPRPMWVAREGTAIQEAVEKKDGKYGPKEAESLILAVHGAWIVTDQQIADFAEKARGRSFRLGEIWVVPDAGAVQRVWPSRE